MPIGSTAKQFAMALKTKRTKTTKKLDALFKAQAPGLVAALRATSPFTGLPEPFLSALSGEGLSPLELDHIHDWDDGQKESVRDTLVAAIDSTPPRKVRFFWELHDGPAELTLIDPSGAGPIKITFFSPRSKVGGGPVFVDV